MINYYNGYKFSKKEIKERDMYIQKIFNEYKKNDRIESIRIIVFDKSYYVGEFGIEEWKNAKNIIEYLPKFIKKHSKNYSEISVEPVYNEFHRGKTEIEF